jgi:hypothetical protein
MKKEEYAAYQKLVITVINFNSVQGRCVMQAPSLQNIDRIKFDQP